MKPSPKNTQNASMMSHIIGYNNNSGLLYRTQMGLNQFKPKKNIIPKPINISNYSNPANTRRTIEEMNADGNVDFYNGNSETLRVMPDKQPPPFTLKGNTQMSYDKSTIKNLYK